jgi:hypothetical protein
MKLIEVCVKLGAKAEKDYEVPVIPNRFSKWLGIFYFGRFLKDAKRLFRTVRL